MITELLDAWDQATPVYDRLVDDVDLDPFGATLWLATDTGSIDLLDRSEPEPWWPNDLRSVAHLIASRMGVEYTGFSAEHQEELRRRLDADRDDSDDTAGQRVVTALRGPTLLGLEAVE